jgi:copper chaperone CopZ
MKSIIEIDGMSCNHCVAAVKKELEKIPGMRIVEVGIGRAVLDADMTAALQMEINAAIRRAGYEVHQS